MSSRPSGPDGPEDVDAAFAEIVAELEREGLGSFALDEEQPSRDTGPVAERAEPPAPPTPPRAWSIPETEWDWMAASESTGEEEHYVPPEPPPLPRPRPATVAGVALLVVGVLLLIAIPVLDLPGEIGTPTGLVALAVGIGWLVLRIRNSPPADSGRDDGAQL